MRANTQQRSNAPLVGGLVAAGAVTVMAIANSVRGAGQSSAISSTPTSTPICRRRCGQRRPIAASAPAISTATPIDATSANRVGMRASPNPGR